LWAAQLSSHSLSHGEIRDVDVLDRVAAARRTSHDHDPLRLRGREQHTGALVAGVDLAQTG